MRDWLVVAVMQVLQFFLFAFRLNIPRMRAEILENIRGPIVDGPVVDRYCGTDRRPPIPKQQAARQRRGPKKDMGDAQVLLLSSDGLHVPILLYSKLH